MENELVEKSFFNTTGTSVQEFQKKVEKADFWGKVGNEEDKNRLMAPDSQFMKAFMKWSATEAIIMDRHKNNYIIKKKILTYSSRVPLGH